MILTPKCVVRTSQGERFFSFTMLSLYTFEVHTGHHIGDEGSTPPLSSMRALLCSLLVPFQREITLAETGKLWTLPELAGVLRQGISVIQACTPLPRAIQAKPADGPPQDWWHIWAAGRHDMGFSEEEFWMLTPLMFQAVVDRIALASGTAQPSPEEKVNNLLRKVEFMNSAQGGIDSRPEALAWN